MNHKLLSFILGASLYSFSYINAQGVFLDGGEAGLFINAGYSTLENGHGISYGGGFAVGELLELSYSFTNTTIELPYSRDIEASSNSIAVGVVLLKKKAQLQVNLGYTSSSYRIPDIIMLGFDVGGRINLHRDIDWYPIFSFAIGLPQGENADNPVTALGASIPLLIMKHFYIGPSFALSEGDFSWGASAGIIISFDTAAG